MVLLKKQTMESRIYIWLNRRFPQNFILKYPLRGFLILVLFTFLFALIYQPLRSHGTGNLTYGETMAIYSMVAALGATLFIWLLKVFRYFSGIEEWTLFKELVAIFLVVLGMGISIYFFAFVIEPAAPRWNLATFWNSVKSAFLVGILPFSFFTIIHLNQLPGRKSSLYGSPTETSKPETTEEQIEIESKLKKEKLAFYPSQFLYAEADGNYVVFYLQDEKEIRKKIIRNSIGQIEEQLANQPRFFRTHRSFIVHLDKVFQKQGNASGYRLKFHGVKDEIPVSRQNTARFDEVWKSPNE